MEDLEIKKIKRHFTFDFLGVFYFTGNTTGLNESFRISEYI